MRHSDPVLPGSFTLVASNARTWKPPAADTAKPCSQDNSAHGGCSQAFDLLGDSRRRAGPASPQRLPAVRRPRSRLLCRPARNHRTTTAEDAEFIFSPHRWCIRSRGGDCAAREEPPNTGFRLCRRSVSGLDGGPGPRERRSANSARHATPRSGSGSCRAQGSNLTSNSQSRIAGLLFTASPTSLALPVYSTESIQVSAYGPSRRRPART